VHVVIVGCGRVGSELAASLERLGHTVAVIDMEPRAFQRWGDLFQGDKIVGRGYDRDAPALRRRHAVGRPCIRRCECYSQKPRPDGPCGEARQQRRRCSSGKRQQ